MIKIKAPKKQKSDTQKGTSQEPGVCRAESFLISILVQNKTLDSQNHRVIQLEATLEDV